MNQRQGRRKTRQKQAPSASATTKQVKSSLYHYTTAAGLIGMVSSQTIWATHSRFLNDTAECRLLNDLLQPQIRTEFENIVPRLVEIGAFRKELLDSLGATGLGTEAARVSDIMLRAIERTAPIYITSFCKHEAGSTESEHGLLSQWRGYGRGGFALEFDEDELDALANHEDQTFWYQAMITREVSYDNHVEMAHLERFKGLAASVLQVLFEEKTPKLAARPEMREILGDRKIYEYITDFVSTLPFLKSPRFREENEYRLVALPTRPGLLEPTEEAPRPYKAVHFREGDFGSLVPYIKMIEDPEKKLPIKKLIVGPHRDQDNQYRAAMLLLAHHEIDIPVLRSDTTLRL